MSEMPSSGRPVGFAHRGARLDEPENTMPAFRRALEAGVDGIETDCWLSADGEVVCAHDATVPDSAGRSLRGRRKLSVRDSPASELAASGVPRLAEVLAGLRPEFGAFAISIDAKHDEVIEPLLEVCAAADALDDLWLCHPDHAVLAGHRSATTAHLVHSRLRGTISTPIERHAHDLARLGIEAMNFHHSEWSGGLVSLFHRFGVRAFAWDVQEERHLQAMLAIGIDALYCDRPERLTATLGARRDAPTGEDRATGT
jgi:glycerophosphoryl diester phosphodiesterase